MIQKKYHFIQNICERRLLENSLLLMYLTENGLVSGTLEESDYILFFSCGMKETDSYNKIENILSHNENGRIIVFGCFPAMCEQKYKERVLYISLQDINELDILLQAKIKISNIRDELYTKTGSKLFDMVIKEWDPRLNIPKCRDVFPLIISTGCSQRCSYCTIRNATGNLKSKSIDGIIKKMEEGFQKGYNIFRFQCENLGTYGMDIGLTLGDLLDEMAKIKHPFSIDLPDLHPKGFIENYDQIINFMLKKEVYLTHIPLQSANQRILDLMNRETDLSKFLPYLDQLKKDFPALKIGTDIIAGFPTETDSEYIDSYNFLKKYRFNWAYLHGYNSKPNAPANDIHPQIDGVIIADRVKYAYDRLPNIACYLNNYRQG